MSTRRKKPGNYLKNVGHKLLHILLEDLLKHGEQDSLEVGDGSGLGLANDPDGQTQGFEEIVVVVRLGRILGRLFQFLGQLGQELCEERNHGLLKRRERSHHAFHDVLIFRGTWVERVVKCFAFKC